ncbi:MAG TPA: hypothetical protein VFN07_12155 [Trueperaceae bacterium]|nr:hypothetical protein [Trueperaceae bacterium]
MELIPLQEWICDHCGEKIASVEDGYVEWGGTGGDYVGFRIVHHQPKSPRGSCYHPDKGHSVPLSHFVGIDGLTQLVALVDPGEHYARENETPTVANFREWVDLLRRTQTPGYEEARQYWSIAKRNEYFDGASEAWPYLQRNLIGVIELGREESET